MDTNRTRSVFVTIYTDLLWVLDSVSAYHLETDDTLLKTRTDTGTDRMVKYRRGLGRVHWGVMSSVVFASIPRFSFDFFGIQLTPM